jgi:GNAT superfamily N-acetyltransferase
VILELLHAAARGDFPPEDGATHVVGAAAGAQAAVLSFTGHHVVAADVPAEEVLAAVDPANLNGPMAPPVLAWLADRTGLRAGSLDVVLAWVPERGDARDPAAARDLAAGREPAAARELAAGRDLAVHEVSPGDHPRITRARRWRRDLRVFAGADGLVVFGRGLADRLELSVEIEPARRNRGAARRLVAAALAAAAPTESVFAQVAAANAASLRALQPVGFAAVGAEVLFGPGEDFLRRSGGVVAVEPRR